METVSDHALYSTFRPAVRKSMRLDVRLEREMVWLSLTKMVEPFERDKSVISRRVRNVFASGELPRAATVAEDSTVQQDGRREALSP